nr:cytochrome P450 [Agasicles hygrophila]
MIFLIFVTVVLGLFVNWCFGIYRNNKLLSKIPGPLPIPFFSSRLPKDNYDICVLVDDLLQKYGKTFKIYFGPSLNVATCDKNLIEAVFKSTDHISKSSMYDLMSDYLLNGIIVSDGDKWVSRRKLCNPQFKFAHLKDFFENFKTKSNDIVKILSKVAAEDTVININDFTAKYQLDVLFLSLLGIDLKVQNDIKNEYISASHTFIGFAALRNFSLWKRFDLLFNLFSKDAVKNNTAVKYLNNFGKKIIADRRKERQLLSNKTKEETNENISTGKTLLDTLLETPYLTDDDILEEINNFLIAGYDTVGTGTAAMAVELSQHKDIQDKLYEDIYYTLAGDFNNLTFQNLQEMRYLDLFVKEVLRLRSPVPLIERVLKEDAVFENTLYPKGTTIKLLLYAMHHQSDYFPDPEKLIPERFAEENDTLPFRPFSKGLRNCIGQRYAIMAMKSLITRLVWEFEFLPVKDFKFEVGYGAVLLSKKGYVVKLQKRQR